MKQSLRNRLGTFAFLEAGGAASLCVSAEGLTEQPRSVLVVEDDPNVAEVVSRYLERDGFRVAVAGDGVTALSILGAFEPDLLVLDLVLPKMSGLEVLARVRQRYATPVIVLTARGQEGERVAGLEQGADDYMAKPFSASELVARVHAVLRRATAGPGGPTRLHAGPIQLDTQARQLWVGGEEVGLTAREHDLLAFLMRHPRQVFRRTELLEAVWGYTIGDTSTVTVHIRHLREKIEGDPSAPKVLKTIWGVGYRFDPPNASGGTG